MNLPLRFDYIPYPLWRRRFPPGVQQVTAPLWDWIYPVKEDRNPPQDAADMADYMVRYRLLPGYTLASVHDVLKDSPAEIEHAPDTPPQPAPNAPIRIPAQWEAMEAVIVNWPVMYPPLWTLHAQMVEAIAPVAEVMVTVPSPMWAHAAWLYLTERGNLGEKIDNVRFVHLPTDDIWVRDYGPIVGYNGDGKRVALDAVYDHLPHYPQEKDDAMPMRWAAHMGIPARALKLHTEGGNLWTDGDGTLIMTEQIFNENPSYNRASLEAYLHQYFDFEKLIITPRLTLEETGHVDLLVKLADANTVLLSSPQTRISREQLQAAMDLFRRESNARGDAYRVVELPTPPAYFNWFAYPIRRSYTNALTVNGRVLVPVYGIPQDAEALAIYRQAMPDHEIIPIDCKTGANGGGAVHCMTKEVPAAR